ncbi:protein phosphatase 2C domain-containing protein [Paenibacillus thalictri]|uniref:PPM-type phosphatase domain-containing protein n=1 Tax=Paenibacillus thalictri TaxID=2527873 RepID=A0A4Q9DQ15_9BACL|nr:protein phosphatase 2C domain-containing protein [Paenibacillus thalictri]TBL75355.1 hypothetical protein EYB31_23395 [Paenibacillus thalictri]
MKIDYITVQGTTEWNEDALVVNEGQRLFGVLDGATSLKPYRGAGGETGGYLATRIIQQYMESLSPEELDAAGLKQIVVQANTRLRDKMIEAGIDVTDKASLWTSGLALVRIGETTIEYAQVGDCMIAAEYEDGSIRTVTRDQVAHIDHHSKKVWENAIRSGVDSRERLWELVKPVILQNKSKMNTSEGYSVISGEPEAADWIEYGAINRMRMKALLLVSDGLFMPKESGAGMYPSMEELFMHVKEKTLAGYAEWLVDLEHADKDCLRYPRFKISDDKTGIYIQFGV